MAQIAYFVVGTFFAQWIVLVQENFDISIGACVWGSGSRSGKGG